MDVNTLWHEIVSNSSSSSYIGKCNSFFFFLHVSRSTGLFWSDPRALMYVFAQRKMEAISNETTTTTSWHKVVADNTEREKNHFYIFKMLLNDERRQTITSMRKKITEKQ